MQFQARNHGRWLFLRTLQNELRPNHANVRVKHTARITRPAVARPAVYFAYSRASAIPPTPAMAKKTVPITSSHRRCRICANVRPVARTALMAAFTRRLRPAMLRTTRNAIPTFRKLEIWLTASILTASGATMSANTVGGEPFRRSWHQIV